MILEMSRSEIEEFVLSQKIGRVGCHVDGETYVVPVIYGWDADCIYVYTTEGKKVDMMRENPRVCFEIDEYLASGGWRSVIVQGLFEELGGDDAMRALQIITERVSSNRETPSTRPRGDGRTPVAFRIRTVDVTGRKVEITSSSEDGRRRRPSPVIVADANAAGIRRQGIAVHRKGARTRSSAQVRVLTAAARAYELRGANRAQEMLSR